VLVETLNPAQSINQSNSQFREKCVSLKIVFWQILTCRLLVLLATPKIVEGLVNKQILFVLDLILHLTFSISGDKQHVTSRDIGLKLDDSINLVELRC